MTDKNVFPMATSIESGWVFSRYGVADGEYWCSVGDFRSFNPYLTTNCS